MSYSVFIGDVARDEYYQLERFPKLGEKIAMQVLQPQLGGMIANAAAVFSSYGNPVRFLSFLHPDDADLCVQLEQAGIDTGLVQYDDKLGPSKCMIYLSEGEHTVFISDMRRHAVEIPVQAHEALCKADVIYSNYWELQWLRCGEMGPVELVRTWAEHGVKIVCDLDVDSTAGNEIYQQFIPYTHLLFLNKVGFAQQRAGRSEEATVQALHEAGLQVLAITLAEQGCHIFQKDALPISVPAVAANVVDVTGAGDTFCSTLTWCYAKCGDLGKSAQFATFAAARSIEHLGARSGAVGTGPVLEYVSDLGFDPHQFDSIFDA